MALQVTRWPVCWQIRLLVSAMHVCDNVRQVTAPVRWCRDERLHSHARAHAKIWPSVEFCFIQCFAWQEHQLRNLRLLPGIVQLHRMIHEKFSCRIDRKDAEELKIGSDKFRSLMLSVEQEQSKSAFFVHCCNFQELFMEYLSQTNFCFFLMRASGAAYLMLIYPCVNVTSQIHNSSCDIS